MNNLNVSTWIYKNSFGKELRNNEITPIEGINNLYALEIKAENDLERLKEEKEDAIMQFVTTGTKLTEREVKSLLTLSSFPGMDEVLALRRVAKLLSGEYDLVILDTAPTGHTLRFLELPDMFSKFTRFLWTARSKTRHLQRFYKRGEKYEADLLLDELLEEGEKIKEAFTAPTTQFIPVTTLDAMALEETENFLKVLHAYKIPVEQMVINKLFSHYQAREIEKFKILSELKLVGMPFFSREIQGIDRLKKFSEILFERKKYFI